MASVCDVGPAGSLGPPCVSGRANLGTAEPVGARAAADHPGRAWASKSASSSGRKGGRGGRTLATLFWVHWLIQPTAGECGVLGGWMQASCPKGAQGPEDVDGDMDQGPAGLGRGRGKGRRWGSRRPCPPGSHPSPHRSTIWTHRVCFLEERALRHWATFTIWNAGRQGRRLYRSLSEGARRKVVAFCDVDEKKIQKGFYCYEESQERPKPRVPILHFRAARPPFVICVKLDLTGGALEDNLRSLHLQEGRDFLHFS